MSALTIITATKPSALPARVLPHSIATAIISTISPGVFGITIGSGEVSADSLSLLLTMTLNSDSHLAEARESELSEHADVVRERIDEVGSTLRDPLIIESIVKGLFANFSQTVSKGQILVTPREIHAVVSRTLSKDPYDPVTLAVSEVITGCFAGLRIVSKSTPIVIQEVRPRRYPSLGDLVIEGMRFELAEAFEKVPLTIDLSGTRFTPAILAGQLQATLARVASVLLQSGNASRQIIDALKLVKMSFITSPEEMRTMALDSSVMNSAALTRLKADGTILRMLDTLDSPTIITQAWAQERALVATEMVIARSKRFETVSLAEAVGHLSFTPIADEYSNLRGGVLSPRVNFQQEYRIGLWRDERSAAQAHQFNRLFRGEETMAQVVGNPAGGDFSDTAHDLAVSVMSNSSVIEASHEGGAPDQSALAVYGIREDDQETTLELFAMHTADSVYVNFGTGYEGDIMLAGMEIIYSKTTNGVRLFADEAVLDGRVYTTSPATVILLAPARRGALALQTKNQLMPDTMYEKTIVGDTESYVVPLAQSYNMRFRLQGIKGEQHIAVSPLKLLGMERHETAVILRLRYSAEYLTAFYVGLIELATWVKRNRLLTVGVEEAEFDRLVDMGVSHSLYSLMAPRLDSEAVRAVSAYVIRELLGSLPGEAAREKALPLFRRRQYKMMTAFRVYIYFLHAAGLIESEKDMQTIVTHMTGSNFFELVTATAV